MLESAALAPRAILSIIIPVGLPSTLTQLGAQDALAKQIRGVELSSLFLFISPCYEVCRIFGTRGPGTVRSGIGLLTSRNAPPRRPRQRSSRPAWIALLLSPPILPFLLPLTVVRAGPSNVTVDDTSTQIVYTPASSWHASTVPCSGCLSPSMSLAFQGTWHDGTHIIPTSDGDDFPTSTSTSAQPSQTSTSDDDKGDDDDDDNDSDVSTQTALKDTDDGKDSNDGEDSDDEKDGDKKDEDGRKGRHRRRGLAGRRATRREIRRSDPTTNPFFTPNFDSDDAGFVDQPVTAQFNFTGACTLSIRRAISLGSPGIHKSPAVRMTLISNTGSAVYVYALIPLGTAQANSTPTFMNLTFEVDSHTDGIYQHRGSASASGFQPTTLVFSKTDMAEAPHSLTIQVGPDSVLLLDSIVYTQGAVAVGDSGASTSNIGPGAQQTGSGTGSPAPTNGTGGTSLCV